MAVVMDPLPETDGLLAEMETLCSAPNMTGGEGFPGNSAAMQMKVISHSPPSQQRSE